MHTLQGMGFLWAKRARDKFLLVDTEHTLRIHLVNREQRKSFFFKSDRGQEVEFLNEDAKQGICFLRVEKPKQETDFPWVEMQSKGWGMVDIA